MLTFFLDFFFFWYASKSAAVRTNYLPTGLKKTRPIHGVLVFQYPEACHKSPAEVSLEKCIQVRQ